MHFDLGEYLRAKQVGKVWMEKQDDENVKVCFLISKKELQTQLDRMKQNLSSAQTNFEEVAKDLGGLF